MKLLFVVLICAFVFLVCFLIDTLFKLIFPKSKLEKSKQVVRPPRRSAVIGVILTFAGVAMLVKKSSWNTGYIVSHRQRCGGHFRCAPAVYLFFRRHLL